MKDVLTAVQAQTDAMNTLVAALTSGAIASPAAEAPAPTVPEVQAEPTNEAKVPELKYSDEYVSKWADKVAKAQAKHGADQVRQYCRITAKGDAGFAYHIISRPLKDNGFIVYCDELGAANPAA
jgi:hypothetical protein